MWKMFLRFIAMECFVQTDLGVNVFQHVRTGLNVCRDDMLTDAIISYTSMCLKVCGKIYEIRAFEHT